MKARSHDFNSEHIILVAERAEMNDLIELKDWVHGKQVNGFNIYAIFSFQDIRKLLYLGSFQSVCTEGPSYPFGHWRHSTPCGHAYSANE